MYTYPNIYCTPPIPIHKKRNKKFAAHRQHNATSARHITQLFQLGRLGVRSHNFCEVPTSGPGVVMAVSFFFFFFFFLFLFLLLLVTSQKL